MKSVCFALLLFATVPQVLGQIRINEVDADTPSTDTAEFLELYGPASASLDGLVLVFYNGNGDVSYAAFDLDGRSLDANGFFVLCGNAANVANCDWDVSPDSNLIQNGVDAVALYMGDDTDFPNGTAPTAANIVDALVYDTDDADDAVLISVLTPGQAQINENGMGMKDTHSNSRVPDGGAALDTSTYTQQTPTPGASNGGTPMPVNPVINEFVANHTGSDSHEFVEIFGEPNTDYSDLSILQLDGDAEGDPGLIDAVYPVGSTDGDGYWFTGFMAGSLNNESITLLLVENFSGMAGDDLDTDDDGMLDNMPWMTLLDDVAVNDEGLGDQVYSVAALTANYDGNIFVPGGASRLPNGVDTDAVGDWTRNDFDGAGLPGFFGTVDPGEAANTPEAVNSTAQPPPPLAIILNEFVANHTGSDDHEYIELFGDPNTDYSTAWILQLDGDVAGNPGRVDSIHQAGVTDVGGFWDTGFLTDQLADESLSLLLVENFTGMLNDDLDTNDDGILDATPWTALLDTVAVDDGDLGDLAYADTALSPNFDGDATVPGGASRIPNGADTNAVADWTRNDFDGEGLMGFVGTLMPGEAVNTPGAFNSTALPGGNDALINEFVANHTGSDDFEYLEIFGSGDTNYSHLWVVQIEGDAENGPGIVDSATQVGTTDADGYWFSGFLSSILENGTMTLFLVQDFSGMVGADLDADDNGVLDATPWNALVDSVAIGDDGPGDLNYSTVTLSPNFDGDFFTPGGASRIPNGTDTDAIADWKRNDFFGEGLPGFDGSLDPHEALNTPGVENSDQAPPGTGAIISEFVVDHVGADTHEYIEIFGTAETDYFTTDLLVIDGEANPGRILSVFPAGLTGAGGFWDTGFLNDILPNGTLTLLCVEDFTGMADDDLDTDDDGVFDSMPWAVLSDSVAVDDGDPGDLVYSTVALGAGLRGGGGAHPGGASRFPYGVDSDTAADWKRNDFDGAGLPGFAGSIQLGEAYNTPGMVTLLTLDDYYADIDTSSGTNLRATLHETIDDHVRFPYTSSFTDSWDVLEMADEDPTNSANILSIYKNASYAKEGGGNANYNREHTWPSSYGFPDNLPGNYPYTDFHHLRLSDSSYNSTRSNIAYGTCNGSCNEAVTDVNNGQGGGSGVYPGNSNWYTGSGGGGTYEVWGGRRGDVARGLLYLDVRYAGGMHGIREVSEPDLELTDDTGLIQTSGGVNVTGKAYMGRRAVLLQWHLDDPVDQLERDRNEVIYQFQGNRNPFVDHPEWVNCIFNDVCFPPCFLNLVSDWLQAPAPCSGVTLDVFDLIEVINGTCVCP